LRPLGHGRPGGGSGFPARAGRETAAGPLVPRRRPTAIRAAAHGRPPGRPRTGRRAGRAGGSSRGSMAARGLRRRPYGTGPGEEAGRSWAKALASCRVGERSHRPRLASYNGRVGVARLFARVGEAGVGVSTVGGIFVHKGTDRPFGQKSTARVAKEAPCRNRS
jgi:hypothetical protein